MDTPEAIFKSYDIRGIYPDQINEENATPIAKAIYSFFLKNYPDKTSISVVLGRDMRLSSPALFEKVKKTLIDLGAEVIVPGIISTPTFYFTVFHYKYDSGIQITASHNPKEYNGLKFVLNSPNGLIKIGKSTGMDEVKRIAMDNGQCKNKTKD
jgi:phosphomannomutase